MHGWKYPICNNFRDIFFFKIESHLGPQGIRAEKTPEKT